MRKEINVRLNANRAKAIHTGHKFASGDKGIVFRIAVDELDTTGTTAKIVFKRSNGTSVEAGISETEGIYSYTTLGNEFAVVGPVVADVKFYEGENRVSTCTFVFDVTADTLDGLGAGTAGYSDTLERMKKSMEQAEADILAAKDELENRAEEILQQMKETAESAEEDVETAEQKMADLSADLEALYQEYVDAFGSTGPFNPRGPYSETETYMVRDMVYHNDESWVCYRNCTGATPSKESDCWQKLSVEAEINPEDFLKTTDVDTELNEESENPIANKAVAEALENVDAKTLDGHKAECFATVVELLNYLSKSGGDISGVVRIFNHLYVRKSDASSIQINLINANRSLYHEIDANGNYVFYDRTNGDRIMHSTADGTNTFNGTASENIKYTDKPTGTYTGNGDATERRILTGGIGRVAVVFSTLGIAFLTTNGSWTISSSGSIEFEPDNFFFSSKGEIVLKTTNSIVNGSGTRIYLIL